MSCSACSEVLPFLDMLRHPSGNHYADDEDSDVRDCRLFVAAAPGCSAGTGPPTGANPWFAIHTDDFWLNLHHYLYVLGRAHAGTPDARQPAVAGALEDERQGLATVADEEARGTPR